MRSLRQQHTLIVIALFFSLNMRCHPTCLQIDDEPAPSKGGWFSGWFGSSDRAPDTNTVNRFVNQNQRAAPQGAQREEGLKLLERTQTAHKATKREFRNANAPMQANPHNPDIEFVYRDERNQKQQELNTSRAQRNKVFEIVNPTPAEMQAAGIPTDSRGRRRSSNAQNMFSDASKATMLQAAIGAVDLGTTIASGPAGASTKAAGKAAIKQGGKQAAKQVTWQAAKSTAKQGAKGAVKGGQSVKFPSTKEVSKRLGVSEKEFHRVVKKDITKTFESDLKKHGIKNPDVGVNSAGKVVLRGNNNGKTVTTDTLLSDFSNPK